MKKVISLLLSVVIAFSVITPAIPGLDFAKIEAEAATSKAPDVYATVFATSDFQDNKSGNLVEENFAKIMNNALADGCNEPDGFILGGDYESSYADKHSTPDAYHRVEDIITGVFPYYNKKNIIALQGNHDINDTTVLDDTGLYEFEHYLVYVIANEDYPAGTGGESAKAKTEATTVNLVKTFDKLLAEGETRPLFIATHIPLHHNSRNPKANNKDADGNVVSVGYNETLYSRRLFQMINEYATVFDIVFMFGHNHSGAYDDYIGGAVNYIAKGDKIRIPDSTQTPSETSYTEETLNFTYMNYGYMGYSNNTNDKTLTMSAFEICPDRIELTRYSADGVYREHTITRTLNHNIPSVNVAGYFNATLGSATGAIATTVGFTDPVYTWQSSDDEMAKISANGSVAQISYNKAGTATVTVTATERNDPSKTDTDSYQVTVHNQVNPISHSIRISTQVVNNETLEYYDIDFGKKVLFVGSYEGLSANVTTSWSSSNTSVATVDQYGEVTLVGSGTTFINYSVTDTSKGYSGTVSAKLIVSNAPKAQYVYEEVPNTSLSAEKEYAIATNRDGNFYLYNNTLGDNGQGKTLVGTASSFAGTGNNRSVTITDDSYLWKAIATGTSGVYYLQNQSSGEYLSASDLAGSTNRGNFVLQSDTPAISAGGWRVASNNNLSNGKYNWYVRGGGITNLLTDTKADYVVLFEKKPVAPSASIEFRGDIVNNTTQTIYSVTDALKVPVYGLYSNIEQLGNETWTSSNQDVVTVDEKGILSFKGVAGTSDITYTVTDAKNNQSYSIKFTIDAKLGSEATRTFKYTKTIKPGKNYVIVKDIVVGEQTMLSGFGVSYEKLLADRVNVQINNQEEFFVNIPADLSYPVWTPEATGNGTYYLRNEEDGKYLFAYADGTVDDNAGYNGLVYTSESYAENTEQYQWSYNGSSLYNQCPVNIASTGYSSANTHVRLRSAEFVGIGTAKDKNVYFFEEIEAEPNGIITLRYHTLGATYERNEICPGQSETFVPKAENFPDNNQVEFRWSIDADDQDIATIDPITGVITYTGKSGNVDLTLTSTSKIYNADSIKPVDKTTVKLIVNGGEIEAPEEPEDPDQPTYVENAFYKTTDLVPGRKYVLHTSYSDAPNLAISNVNKSGLVRLLCETIDAPMTDANGEYVVSTNNNHIWECVKSDVDGYVYLKNVATGEYLFTSESTATTDKRQIGVAADITHPEAANVTNPTDTFLFTYDSSKGMLFSKQVEDTGSVYGVGNVAKSSGGYYYIRPTYNGSSSSPVSFITLYAEPEKETGDETGPEYFYLTNNFVDGEKYILRAIKENESGNSISIAVSGIKNGTSKLEGVSVVPAGNVIENEDTNIVWICEASGSADYFYLKNVESGEYLRIDKNGDIVTTSATKDDNAALTYYAKNGQMVIGSKASKSNLIRYNNGFYESSSGAVFELWAKGDKPTGGEVVLPVGDIFKYTETLIPGNKYVIATGKAGTVSVMSTGTYNEKDYEAPKTITTDVYDSNNEIYIVNPHDAIIVECVESGTEGYYYLKDENNRYLVIGGYSENSGTNKVVEFVDSLDKYAPEAYTIRVRSTNSDYTTLESRVSDFKYLNLYESSSNPANNRFVAGKSYREICLFAYDEEVSIEVKPLAQIRKVDYFGSVDISGVMQYRYEINNGDTEQLYRYIEALNDGYTYTWTSSDTSIATIGSTSGLVTYKGNDGHVTFTLTVTGTDLTGKSFSETISTTFRVSKDPYKISDDDYPIYPDEGSVRVNKIATNVVGDHTFQETGVTEIELSATGVPVSLPVDVVVVLDHSDSMNNNNQLLHAINDTRDFALQLFNANENNRIAVVTFDQFRNHYETIDSQVMKNNANGNEDRIVTGNGTIQNAFVKQDQMDKLADDLETLSVNAYGGTNYDSGLNYAYRILQYAKTDPNANKNQVVVFMSDGAPTKFNGLRIDDIDEGTIANAWLTGDETHSELATYLNNTDKYPAAKYFNANGENWFATAIKTPEGQNVAGLPDVTLYDGYHTGLGAKIYTIGYNSGSQAAQLLTKIASDPSNYYAATSNLQEAYNSILEQIVYSATDAVVTDKMGAQFDVQFAPSVTIQGEKFDITPTFEVGSWTLDNQGNRIEYNVMEKITFTTNSSGALTGAASTVVGDAFDAVNNTVKGQYVSYNLLTETFTWNIGDINRNEITLKYYASLTGVANGDREAGVYETNEFANLSYTNYRGTENCTLYFPVPTLAWKQAAVSYEFYLVNNSGKPVNLNGIEVPFTERVIIGREQTMPILLNSENEIKGILSADEMLPEGYELFNADASFYIVASSATVASSASISDSTLTTYFRQGTYFINVNGEVPGVKDYNNTAVSFAVKMSKGLVPDTIVIDYGLPVKIQVLGNDYVVDGGKITGIAKTVANGTLLNNKAYASSMLENGGEENVEMTYGKVSIAEDSSFWYPEHLVYTPTSTAMGEEDVFYYEYYAGGEYYYAQVVVIPATNIYYEESFMTFVDGDGYEWDDVGTTLNNKFQAEDRPGNFAFDEFDTDNAYGYDEAYNDSYTYSLGSAKKTTVDQASFGKEPTAKFTFCGTGFDLFSVTSNDTGMIQVTIYNAGTTTIYKNFLVNTYYGYKSGTDADGKPIILPDLESTAGLYQVPVISRRNLDYGTYDVVIKPLYSRAFDPNYADGKGDYSIYVDSVRIFNPAGVDGNVSDAVGDAYLKDGEYAPQFMEIRDALISSETFYNEAIPGFSLNQDDPFSGALFIDGNINNGIDETGIATYTSQGPKNEVYLGKNQAIAFNVTTTDLTGFASLQLGMKVISGGETSDVVIMNSEEKSPEIINVSGAHEMFRSVDSATMWDMTEYKDSEGNVYYKTKYPIVIANVSDTVVSLTSLKCVYTFAPGRENTASMNLAVYEDTPMIATFAMRRAMAVAEPYNEENVTIEWSDTSFVEGKEATLTVTTLPEVVRVTVDGIDITDCEINEDGNKVWTYTFTVVQTGENAYDVVLYDRNGEYGDAIKTETIYVEEAPEEIIPDAPETEEPSDDNTGNGADEDDSADNGENGMSIFSKIIEFIKKIINFFRRVFA